MYLRSMRGKRESRKGAQNRRKGSPFMLYLHLEQAQRLEKVSRKRHVPKSELIRVAIDRFLADLEQNSASDSLGVNF